MSAAGTEDGSPCFRESTTSKDKSFGSSNQSKIRLMDGETLLPRHSFARPIISIVPPLHLMARASRMGWTMNVPSLRPRSLLPSSTNRISSHLHDINDAHKIYAPIHAPCSTCLGFTPVPHSGSCPCMASGRSRTRWKLQCTQAIRRARGRPTPHRLMQVAHLSPSRLSLTHMMYRDRWETIERCLR